ncbi:MAG: hypothetical protein DI539_01860 [Flavobacterium psychrophilum]|nr:MAG: hypothetical protein DI539_01860 [Flavobacterium psychrophilum]
MKSKFLLLLFFTCLFYGQNNFRPTHVYDGHITTSDGKNLNIKLNFLILLDSTMVGSYYYNPSFGSLKIAGHFNSDFTFGLVERDSSDVITGFFEGKLSKDFKSASGKWTDSKKEKQLDFSLSISESKSYWDYIRKNRALYEYKDLKKAIRNKSKVQSIDVSHQSLEKLPEKLSQLDKIVSINLLGNHFETFPSVLSKLTTLDEISLSSNRLKSVGPEIGNLKNLRILIMNFNGLNELPKEIGSLTNLLYLEIGNNKLTTLPEEIKYLTQLQELHIDGNKLSDKEKSRIKKLLPNCVIHF